MRAFNIDAALRLIVVACVPIAGAVGYIHGNFATQDRVSRLEVRTVDIERTVHRTEKLICKMAIRQNLKDADRICIN